MTQPQASPESKSDVPLQLSVIRKWPEGFEARLQAVWLDVVSFIPNVKLYDLQRVLAEFGFRMEVYKSGAAQAPCSRCGGTGVVPDGEIDCYENGESFTHGPVKCVKDCPVCAKSRSAS